MTTKARARTYRLKRDDALAEGVTAEGVENARAEMRAARRAAQAMVPDTLHAAAAGDIGDVPATQETSASAATGEIDTPQDVASDTSIAEIRREGLTGRQLRLARRMAQKHGLAPTSDFDAVRQLRAQGIDPFERAAVLELVPTERRALPDQPKVQLPQTVRQPSPPQPATPVATPVGIPDDRAEEITRIQQDIARRRRRKTLALFSRLALFVLLPTLIAGWYFAIVATPMYATESEFVIQQADATASSTAASGLAQVAGMASHTDSTTVQSYLQSRDAMQRLDADLDFKAHFQQPWIDPIQRLSPDASNEETYELYKRKVQVGFDPSEGFLTMEVVATDPQTSQAFSQALIRYAEQQVDQLTKRLRDDQMAGASLNYDLAERNLATAQANVLALQEKLGVLDPASETGSLMQQITTFEVQLSEKKLELEQHLANPRPNDARVRSLNGDITRLERLISDLRGTMTETTAGEASLARISGELRIAEGDLSTRQLILQQAAQQVEMARVEANRQVRYLAVGVRPIAPDEPTYPRAFENTLLAFALFAGIYLMISLTVSVLREQVTA